MRVSLRILEPLLLMGRLLTRTTKTFFILFRKDAQFSTFFFFFSISIGKVTNSGPSSVFLNNKNILSACNEPVKHRAYKYKYKMVTALQALTIWSVWLLHKHIVVISCETERLNIIENKQKS